VPQVKPEEFGWLRAGPTDTELKYCGTAGKPGGQKKKLTSIGNGGYEDKH